MEWSVQNAIIILGAIVGILAGGWTGVSLFYEAGDPGSGVIMFFGAIPGSVAGAWIGYKASDR